jgi:hypothetical protein
MIGRALDAGVLVGWVTGDQVYGQEPGLRRDLIGRSVGYVLAVPATIALSQGSAPAARPGSNRAQG